MKEILKFIGEFFQSFISVFKIKNELIPVPIVPSPKPGAGPRPQPSPDPESENQSPLTRPSIKLADTRALKTKTYRVEYDAFRHKLDYTWYPTVLIPFKGTIIKPPQIGRNGNVGISEKKFLQYVKKHFTEIFHVSNEMSLFIKGKSMPYEPDITLWNVIDDKLICIDIEIDEPYAGGTNSPTHCKGYDVERNKDFLNRGWTVIRFTENQVVEYPERCCKVIAEVVDELVDIYTIPKELIKEKGLNKEEYWDENKSEQLARNRTREKLLNIPNFGYVEEQITDSTIKDEFDHLEEEIRDQYGEFNNLIKKKKGKGSTKKTDKTQTRTKPKQTQGQDTPSGTPDGDDKKDNIDRTINQMEKEKTGVGGNGTLTTSSTSKPIKETRHYGGKLLDDRILKLMKPKHNSYSLALFQKNNIERDFDFLQCRIERGKLICKGKVQPEFCSEYELKIVYEEGFVPRVFITKPEITPENKIHMYPDGSLCLYYPNDFTWRDNMNIADYFIPWAIEWIYCYEYYLLTGEWKHEEAPGHEIVDYESKRKKKAS